MINSRLILLAIVSVFLALCLVDAVPAGNSTAAPHHHHQQQHKNHTVKIDEGKKNVTHHPIPTHATKPGAVKPAPTTSAKPANKPTSKPASVPSTKPAPKPPAPATKPPAAATKPAPKPPAPTTKPPAAAPSSNFGTFHGIDGPHCTHGAMECSTATSLRICVSGEWQEEQCPSETLCSEKFGSNPTCVRLGMVPPASPKNKTCFAKQSGTSTCYGASVLASCGEVIDETSGAIAYEWSFSKCPEKSYCFVNAKFEGGCVNTPDDNGSFCGKEYEKACSNDYFYKTCVGFQWITQPCPLGTVCKTVFDGSSADGYSDCVWA